MSGNLGNIAKGVAQNAGEAITGIFKSGLSWGKNLISSMGGGFSSMTGFLGNSASSVASGALNAIKGIFSGGFNIGKNLIEGIWNGISSMGDWIMRLIGGFAGNIVQCIKDFFKIKSPSRVMRDQVGVMLAKGVGVGFENETENIQDSMSKNLSDLTAKMQATVNHEVAFANSSIVARNNQGTSMEATTLADTKDGDVFIVKNYMDSEEISEYTYKKVDGKFAMAGKRVR